MKLITQGKTNVKYLLIVIILAIFAGVLMIAISKMTECPCWWPSSQPQQVLPTDETANWQTYRNEEYGFEISYPPSLVISDKASETANYSLLLEIGSTISIGIEKAIYTLEQKIEDYRFTPVPIPVEELEEVVVGQGNYKAQKWSYMGAAFSPEPGPEEETIAFSEYFIEHKGNLYQIHYSIYPSLQEETFNQILSTFRFIEKESFTNDDLLHKLFPNLEFNNGVATLPQDYKYLSLYLDKKIEDYFVNNEEKNILLMVNLDGVPHVGGLYHVYLGIYDLKGNLITPTSSFPEPDDYFDFFRDESHFGGDQGNFGFYDCKGIKYIAFAYAGCPNGTCCSGNVKIFRINNRKFEEVQSINEDTLVRSGSELSNLRVIIFPPVYAAADPSYALKMILSDEKIIIKKVPVIADERNCQESDYKLLNWNKNNCRFE